MRTVPVFDLDPHLSPHATVAHGVVERVSQSYSLGVWSWDSATVDTRGCAGEPRGSKQRTLRQEDPRRCRSPQLRPHLP